MTTTVESTTNHLMIGGMDTVKLAEQFGTPLVAYDTQDIVRQVKAFQQTWRHSVYMRTLCQRVKWQRRLRPAFRHLD